MEFLDLAKTRYSSRKYSNKPVEEEKLKKILEAGRIAPSAANNQPWILISVRKKQNIFKLSEAYPRDWFRDAPIILVICGDHSLSWKRKDGKDHCDIDIAIAVDHITLQAAELGLGTCWICNFDSEKASEILKLSGNIEPIVFLALGYPGDSPDMERHKTKRKNISEIYFQEHF